ncbi:MAG: hypothetical protein GY906_37540 [bacterium]|nr:hypothetical protein [bacterium]
MFHSSTSNSDRGDQLGLILADEKPPSGLLARFGYWLSIVVFAAGIFSALLVDSLGPVTPIKLRGEEARAEIKLRRDARVIDGSMARLIEHDLRMKSRIRRMVIGPYAWMLYRWMGHVKEGVILGDDGWLFLRNRVEVLVGEPDEAIALAVANVAALERRLGALGFEIYVLPVPRKCAVHADKLPARIDARPELDRLLIESLKQYGTPTADVMDTFMAELSEPAYHSLGSHWDDPAELAAAEAFARLAGIYVEPEERRSRIDSTPSPVDYVDTDLLEFAGVYFDPKIPESARRTVHVARLNVEGAEGQDLHLAKEIGEIVVLGTSFTAQRRFPHYLSHYCDQWVWSGAKAGGRVDWVVAEFITQPEARKGMRKIFLEIPNHFLLGHTVHSVSSGVFGVVAPPTVISVRDISPSEYSVAVGEILEVGPGGAVLVAVEGGKIAHAGDGTLAIRLRGETTADLKIHSTGGGTWTLPTTWPANQKEVVLPLISAGTATGRIVLRVVPSDPSAGPTQVRLDAAEVVSEMRHTGSLTQALSEPTRSEAGWQATVLFDGEGVKVGDLAVLHVHLTGAEGLSGAVRLEVRANEASSPGLSAEFSGLDQADLIAVGLGPLRGQKVTAVSLVGSGSPPGDLAGALTLIPDLGSGPDLY